MAKTRYEKMEELFQKMMNEGSLDEKINELQLDPEELKNERKMKFLKFKNAVGRGESQEVIDSKRAEYEEALDKEKKFMENKEDREKELKLYKAFKENKEQIINIREYRDALESKLEKLNDELVSSKVSEIIDRNIAKTKSQLEEELQKNNRRRMWIAKELKNPKLSQDKKIELEDENRKLLAEVDENNKKYQELEIKRKEQYNVRDTYEISKDIKRVESQLNKCDAIWTCLLKGKSWDEIGVILREGTFTAPRGTMNKMRLGQSTNLEKTVELDASEISKYISNSNTKNQTQAQSKPQEQQDIQTKAEPEVLTETFESKHQKLAKIPFIRTIAKKIYDIRHRNDVKALPSGGQNIQQSPINQITQNVHNDEKDLEYIDQEMQNGREEDMFYMIANRGGYRKTVEVDQETKNRIEQVAKEFKEKEEKEAADQKRAALEAKYEQMKQDAAKREGVEVTRPGANKEVR